MRGYHARCVVFQRFAGTVKFKQIWILIAKFVSIISPKNRQKKSQESLKDQLLSQTFLHDRMTEIPDWPTEINCFFQDEMFKILRSGKRKKKAQKKTALRFVCFFWMGLAVVRLTMFEKKRIKCITRLSTFPKQILH